MQAERLRFLVMLLLLLSSSSALANTLTVSKWGTPDYQVLQEALDAAAPGDTILIQGGTFAETTTRYWDSRNREAVGWIDKPLTVIGSEQAWLDGPDGTENYCLFTNHDCSFQGIQIKDGGGYGILIWAGTSKVRDCKLQDLGDGVFCGNPGAHVSVSDSEFYRCYYSCIGVTISAIAEADSCYFEARTGPGAVSKACYVSWDGSITLSNSEFIRYGMVEIYGPGIANVTGCTARDLRVSALLAWNGGVIHASQCSCAGGDSLPGPNGMEVSSGGRIIADSCRFDDMTYGAVGSTSGFVELHDSEITNSRLYAVLLDSYTYGPKVTLDFTGNWWGTTDSTAIAASIYDGHDDPVKDPLGFVEFWPIRDVPLPAQEGSFGRLKAQY